MLQYVPVIVRSSDVVGLGRKNREKYGLIIDGNIDKGIYEGIYVGIEKGIEGGKMKEIRYS
jgi:hypothetical protein